MPIGSLRRGKNRTFDTIFMGGYSPIKAEKRRLTIVVSFSVIDGLDLAEKGASFKTVCQCEWANYLLGRPLSH